MPFAFSIASTRRTSRLGSQAQPDHCFPERRHGDIASTSVTAPDGERRRSGKEGTTRILVRFVWEKNDLLDKYIAIMKRDVISVWRCMRASSSCQCSRAPRTWSTRTVVYSSQGPTWRQASPSKCDATSGKLVAYTGRGTPKRRR